MAYTITDECISCGACETECKNEAITEGETAFVIDTAKCTECIGWFDSPRCVEVCPVDACVLDTAHEESREELLNKWRKLHPGENPATT